MGVLTICPLCGQLYDAPNFSSPCCDECSSFVDDLDDDDDELDEELNRTESG